MLTKILQLTVGSRDSSQDEKNAVVKVQLFWEGHKNLPHGFDIYLV